MANGPTKEKLAQIKGEDKKDSFAEAAKKLAKEYDKSNTKSSSNITKQLSENAKKSFESLKEMARPGSLIKSVGLMTGSPFIMTVGDKINDMLSFEEEKAVDDKQSQKEFMESLEDQGYNSEQIKAVLDEIQGNTEPNFRAEEIADEQNEQQEKQLTFLEQMVDGIKSLGDKIKELPGGGSFLDFLAMLGIGAAVIIAPFVAMAGFFTGIKDSVNSIFKVIMKPINAIKKLFNLKGLGFIDDVAEEVPKKISKLSKFFKKISGFFSKINAVFKASDGMFARILKRAFSFGKIFGKIFPFIQLITGIWETVTGAIEGFKEEGIIGAIKGGIKGLINGLIFSLIDMVKDGIAWIAGYFGFENIKTALDSFSFVELFNSLVDKIFNSIQYAFDYIKGLFAWPESFGEGLATFVDLIYMPLNMAIDFIKDLFKWGDPEKPFKMSEFISETVDDLFTWLKDLITFDKDALLKSLPDWAQKLAGKFSSDKPEIETNNKIIPGPDLESEIKMDSFMSRLWQKLTGTPESPIIEPTKKDDLLLSSRGNNASISAIAREQQLQKIEKNSGEQNITTTAVDQSTTNNISATDMSLESPDRSLTYMLNGV